MTNARRRRGDIKNFGTLPVEPVLLFIVSDMGTLQFMRYGNVKNKSTFSFEICKYGIIANADGRSEPNGNVKAGAYRDFIFHKMWIQTFKLFYSIVRGFRS